MATMRKIVKIDEDKCDGCGLCVPSCAEGAIRIIDGKARLVAENLCDGLGACLGECPRGAITIEERPAAEFDESAVEEHKHQEVHLETKTEVPSGDQRERGASSEPLPCGCPGSMMRMLRPASAKPQAADRAHAAGTGNPVLPIATTGTVKPGREAPARGLGEASQLRHWPVQLALVPVTGPIWQDADVLISADCVPFALADFHERLLPGKSLAIACPKLDDVQPYVKKLATIFANNKIKSITVAHMEVPCCTGIVRVVRAALEQAGRTDVPVHDVTVGVDGRLMGAE